MACLASFATVNHQEKIVEAFPCEGQCEVALTALRPASFSLLFSEAVKSMHKTRQVVAIVTKGVSSPGEETREDQARCPR